MPRAGLSAESVTREAARIVDAEGLGALSLARLAQSLGVAAPSLYKHVKGLDGLVAGLVDLTANAFADALAEASVGRSGKGALQAIASAYRSFAHSHPGTYPPHSTLPASASRSGRRRSRRRNEGLPFRERRGLRHNASVGNGMPL